MAIIVMRGMVVLTGLVFLWLDFYSFARRRIVANIGLGWGAFSLQLVLVGTIPGLSAWAEVIDLVTFLGLYVLGIVALLGVWLISVSLSKLIMRNQELAMMVSLLNQENERILKELETLAGKDRRHDG
ncbi:MAG: hypothetical protein LBQ15_00320 [Clostridium sp.]|jgi:hypothetical protein|nr:hypothetical protein [Clostridium sp.]